MRPLNKSERFTTRFTPEQALRIQRAAAIESQRRGERVTESTIIRDGALSYADGILEGNRRRITDRTANRQADRRSGDHTPDAQAA